MEKRPGIMEVEAGWDIFSGAPDSFFGGFKQNDRMFVKVRVMF